MIWEYKYIYKKWRTDNQSEINDFLRDFGREGWELVQVIVGSGDQDYAKIHGFVFKRPVDQNT